MTFKAKIDSILNANTLGITSVSGLEDFLKAGRGAINEFYNKDKEPGRKTLKRILALPGLNMTWWETGKGDVFCRTFGEKHTHEHNKAAVMEKSDDRNEKSMEQTIDDLIGMLKEDNAFLREQFKMLQESNEKLRTSLDIAHNDYVKLTTITLTHGQK